MLTSAHRLVTMANIKVNLVSNFRPFGCLSLLCAEKGTDSYEDESKDGTTEHGGRQSLW